MSDKKLQNEYSALVYRLLPLRCIPRPIKRQKPAQASAALKALSAAALALPGITSLTAVAADTDQASFQYGFYEEGRRKLLESYQTLKLSPIRVDNFVAGGNTTFSDRIKLAFNFTQDTWSGATPLTTAPAAAMTLLTSGASEAIQSGVLTDKQGQRFYAFDSKGRTVEDKRTVHMMTMASPETRKQGDAKLGYEWDKLALDIGGGVSVENDYDSYFLNTNGRLDLNNKLTTLSWGLNYADSSIKALRIAQYSGYIDYATLFDRATLSQRDSQGNLLPLTGERKDWTARLSLTQVLSKNSVLEGGIGYTHSSGFLENPYKVAELLFIDPKQQADANGLVFAQTQGVAERRPDLRQQWTFNTRLVQHFQPTDAAIHLGYRFFHDDWGINAHTFEADWAQPVGNGWSVTPRIRYYSQSAADFYKPYFVINQAISYTRDFKKDYSRLPIANFSSDQRLSGYGALSGGLTLSKQFAKGIHLDAGFEYYTHQGSLKIGGGGESDFADYSSYLLNAALRVDFSALSNTKSTHDHGKHNHHTGHGADAPAGVMFDHMLSNAGDVMVGYRYMYSPQSGNTIHASHSVSDSTLVKSACEGSPCYFTPIEHNMHMHMLDIMYAPTDWLTLMLMPQFVDMNMSFRPLEGAPPLPVDNSVHQHGSGGAMEHATGGIGDTGLYTLFRLLNFNHHQVNMTLGLSAPTGDIEQKINGRSFIHYGMQLGSGTWDFKPSLTYTGHLEDWGWGLQVNGTKRLEDRNKSGFSFGDMLQSTAWGSYDLFDWLSASLRGVYTVQNSIKGSYNGPHDNTSPVDFPGNYGGQFWDVGFGLNAKVTGGDFQGNRFGVEWLQPIHDAGNGYQLEREGSLNATWKLAF